MDIKIYHKNFELSTNLKEYVEEKFGALSKYKMDVLGFHVDITKDPKHQKGDVYTVDAHLHLPNKYKITLTEVQDDAYAAVDMLQAKLARQLVEHKAKSVAKLRKTEKKFKSLKFWQKDKEY